LEHKEIILNHFPISALSFPREKKRSNSFCDQDHLKSSSRTVFLNTVGALN